MRSDVQLSHDLEGSRSHLAYSTDNLPEPKRLRGIRSPEFEPRKGQPEGLDEWCDPKGLASRLLDTESDRKERCRRQTDGRAVSLRRLPRYRFAEFVLSPRQRVLTRNGCELPLIPRYFDLLVFLVEHRGEAVHRRDIFDRVWSDVIVSDSALSQAIRTLRRTLDDDSREPLYIRTVSRHGCRFVGNVVEEADDVGSDAESARFGRLAEAGKAVHLRVK